MAINLHNIVGAALTCVNDWSDIIFTKRTQVWTPESRQPQITTQALMVKGKLQRVSTQDAVEMGFNQQEYQYFSVHISAPATQMDRLRQFGADTFICNDYEYKVVAKEPWDDAGWRKIYAYRVKYVGDNDGR